MLCRYIAHFDVLLPQLSFASQVLYIIKLLHSGKLTSLLAIMALKVFIHVEANQAVTPEHNEANGLIALLELTMLLGMAEANIGH